MEQALPIRSALISVFHKDGLAPIVKKLNDPLIEYCTKNVIPSGSRDMILFKNLAVQFVKEKLSVGAIETLVTAIIANCPNKKESEFYGWIEKAKKGIITEYNKQEMNRWIKKQKINVAWAMPTA